MIHCDAETSRLFLLLERTFTGKHARCLIDQSKVREHASSLDKLVVLDEACGTGIITKMLIEDDILDDAAKAKLEVTCADYAQAMVNAVARRSETSGWKNVKAVCADAMDTKLPSVHFSHIFFNFGPFMLQDSFKALTDCHRILQPGGTLGITCWKLLPWVEEYTSVFEAHPESPPFLRMEQVTTMFPQNGQKWNNEDDVRHNLEVNGFVDVEVNISAHSSILSLEDHDKMLFGMLQTFTALIWTEEQRKEWMLPVKNALQEHMVAKYSEGKIEWYWEAIVGTGKKPA